MAYLRISPATALPTVRQMGGELGRWIKEAGAFQASRMLQDLLDGLDSYCASSALYVEVLLAPELTDGQRDTLAVWIHPGLAGYLNPPDAGEELTYPKGLGHRDLDLAVRSLGQSIPQRAGVPRAPVLILALGQEDYPDDYLLGDLESLVEDRPVVILALPAPRAWAPELRHFLQGHAAVVETIELQAPPEPTLTGRFAVQPWDGALDLLRAQSALQALEGIGSAFALALDNEIRGYKVKRALASQRAGEMQQAGPLQVRGTTEITQELRSVLHQHFGDYGRGIEERWRLLTSPQQGSLTKDVDAFLKGIETLEKEERVRTMAVKVPLETEGRLLDLLRGRLTDQGNSDLQSMRDLLQIAGKELEQTLMAKENLPFHPQIQYLSDDRLRSMVGSQLFIERKYAGEVPKHGFGEFIAAAKQWQMPFSVATFMLIQILRTFGDTNGATMKTVTKVLSVLSVTLLIAGIPAAVRRIKRERLELDGRELAKARDSLRSEARRILTEFQRTWLATLDAHLKAQSSETLEQAEDTVREYLTRKAAESSEEKLRLQRQLQGLETLERRVAQAGKGRDQLAATLAQVRGDLTQLFLGALNPAPQRRY